MLIFYKENFVQILCWVFWHHLAWLEHMRTIRMLPGCYCSKKGEFYFLEIIFLSEKFGFLSYCPIWLKIQHFVCLTQREVRPRNCLWNPFKQSQKDSEIIFFFLKRQTLNSKSYFIFTTSLFYKTYIQTFSIQAKNKRKILFQIKSSFTIFSRILDILFNPKIFFIWFKAETKKRRSEQRDSLVKRNFHLLTKK